MNSSQLHEGFIVQLTSRDAFFRAVDRLYDEVFSDIHRISLNSLISESEQSGLRPNADRFEKLEHLYLLIYNECNEVAGWHFGYQNGPSSYYMCNSAILPQYRGRGLYSRLLAYLKNHVSSRGYLTLTSRHHVTNNDVIIPKLKAGFHITGMQITLSFGTVVELSWHKTKAMNETLAFRSGAAPRLTI